jgi:NAD(P)-dependent dehydrogenase (short-subunit alcohol dehydrogenase family)
VKTPGEGQSIAITGAAQGIGFHLAEHLARLGGRVTILDVNAELASSAAERLRAVGGDVESLECDVTDSESVTRAVGAVLQRRESIDVLINNAGVFPLQPVDAIDLKEWHRVIDINLTGTFLMCRAVVGPMKRQGSGRIINVSSVAGRVGGAGFVHYSAAKAGVIGFTKALAREVAVHGILVNAVAPGIIETPTARAIFPDYALKEYVRMVPQGRLGHENDLNGIVEFLCSAGSGYLTGQTLAVDGGYTMV